MVAEPGAPVDLREGARPLDRLVRFVLVAYLSPVILIVLAIGLVGMLAAKIGRPTTRFAIEKVNIPVEGVHTAHGANRPLGLDNKPVRVREVV